MLIYNVTNGVDRDIEKEWLDWMKNSHIPRVMKTNLFVSYKIYKVLSSEDDTTISYAIQYTLRSLADMDVYLEKHAPALRDEVKKKYGEKVASFRTLLEEV